MPDPVDFGWDSGQSPDVLADRFAALDAALDDRLVEAMETLALMIEGTAKRLVAVDTGRLKSSIASQVKQKGSTIIGYVGSNLSYAPTIEYGRGPIPADSGYLRFTIEGEVFYRKSVDAAPAQPFLRPAVQSHKSDLERLSRKTIAQAKADVGLA
jgi:hypothetical protein